LGLIDGLGHLRPGIKLAACLRQYTALGRADGASMAYTVLGWCFVASVVLIVVTVVFVVAEQP
jgi:hypothetical protein